MHAGILNRESTDSTIDFSNSIFKKGAGYSYLIIEMTLLEGSGIGFLEDNKPGDDHVAAVGAMEI